MNTYISNRYLFNDKSVVIKTDRKSYLVINIKTSPEGSYFYKIPSGFESNSFLNSYISLDTYYINYKTTYNFNQVHEISAVNNKFLINKPIYYNRFKYVGKGFKLIFRKKKNIFNCVFGYSHIYWVKLQNTFIKKTKKYKFFFVVKNLSNFIKFDKILKHIKPINRYTLRGVRTYTNSWIKRKGRKSVATHV